MPLRRYADYFEPFSPLMLFSADDAFADIYAIYAFHCQRFRYGRCCRRFALLRQVAMPPRVLPFLPLLMLMFAATMFSPCADILLR